MPVEFVRQGLSVFFSFYNYCYLSVSFTLLFFSGNIVLDLSTANGLRRVVHTIVTTQQSLRLLDNSRIRQLADRQLADGTFRGLDKSWMKSYYETDDKHSH